MNRKILAVSAAIVLGFSVGTARSATTGTITIQGSVPQVLAISVAGVGSYNALDLSSTQTDLTVANVTELSNSRTGYTVTVSSANGGNLVHSTSPTVTLGYTAKYGSSATLNLGSVATVTDQATPGVHLTTKAFKVSYTGAAAQSMLEGTYSDTLTFTIAAK